MTLPVDSPNTDGAFLAAADVDASRRLDDRPPRRDGRRDGWALRPLPVGHVGCTGRRDAALPSDVLGGVLRARQPDGLYDGLDWQDGAAGEISCTCRGGVHAFPQRREAPVSMLILFAPAPPREAYFQELAERIASGVTYSDEDRTAFLARHDQFEV